VTALPLRGSDLELGACPSADLFQKQIKRQAVLGGLINEYERAAAAITIDAFLSAWPLLVLAAAAAAEVWSG